ncbi:DUF3883 domain-containing protein [Hyphomicrobiales bacterium]|nr:DUF3883 domain-containing protein [Hyphomicrobiales bacterium]
MIKSTFISLAWKEMALEVINAAKKQWTVADFKQHCKRQKKTIEKSYEARIFILNSLIDQNIVLKKENKLSIGYLPRNGEFYSSLFSGNTYAWELVSEIFPETDEEILFDEAHLKEIGAIGEKFILDELKSALPSEYHKKIDQVSNRDDTAGYDIATPSVINFDKEVYLEVKTTTVQTGDFGLYISSNEYRISQKEYDHWYLVLVKIINNVPKLIGHIPARILANRMPNNVDSKVKWKSSKVYVQNDWLEDKLP